MSILPRILDPPVCSPFIHLVIRNNMVSILELLRMVCCYSPTRKIVNLFLTLFFIILGRHQHQHIGVMADYNYPNHVEQKYIASMLLGSYNQY